MAERIERVDEEQEKLERRRSGSRKPNMDQHEGLVVWASPGNPRIPTASRARLIPPNNAIVTGPRFGVGGKRRCHDAGGGSFWNSGCVAVQGLRGRCGGWWWGGDKRKSRFLPTYIPELRLCSIRLTIGQPLRPMLKSVVRRSRSTDVVMSHHRTVGHL